MSAPRQRSVNELGLTADAGSTDNGPGPYSGGCTLRRPGPHPDRRIAQIYRRFEAQVTIIEKGAGAGRLSEAPPDRLPLHSRHGVRHTHTRLRFRLCYWRRMGECANLIKTPD